MTAEPRPVGRCPRCGGTGSVDSVLYDRCPVCGGSGSLEADRPWTAEDDALLRERFTAGATAAAIALRRPLGEIFARASELGVSRPEPEATVRLVTSRGRVNIDDAVRGPEGW